MSIYFGPTILFTTFSIIFQHPLLIMSLGEGQRKSIYLTCHNYCITVFELKINDVIVDIPEKEFIDHSPALILGSWSFPSFSFLFLLITIPYSSTAISLGVYVGHLLNFEPLLYFMISYPTSIRRS